MKISGVFAPFAGRPERVAMVAAAMFTAAGVLWFSRRRGAWACAVAGLAWSASAVWEWHCREQGYNIRVDLFVIVPALIVVTLWALLAALGVVRRG